MPLTQDGTDEQLEDTTARPFQSSGFALVKSLTALKYPLFGF